MTTNSAAPESPADDRAVTRLKKQREFRGHLVTYLVVNAFLIVIWAVTSHGFFWPAFVLGGWGIFVLMNAWEVYGRRELPEVAIARETGRGGKRG